MRRIENIIRSATLENCADEHGVVDVELLGDMYSKISASTCVTGFVYISEDGRAMQTHQAGIVNSEQQRAWSDVVSSVRAKRTEPVKLIMQLAHTGLQTTRSDAISPSGGRSPYFKTKSRAMTPSDISRVAEDFAMAARRASEAGFDGVQIHAAHGYLIHQFLSPSINRRPDRYKEGSLFLENVVSGVRKACPSHFGVSVKISISDDAGEMSRTIDAMKRLEGAVDFCEISCGTMAKALDIFRGGCPLDTLLSVNPLYNRYPRFAKTAWRKFAAPAQLRRFKPFSNCYNLAGALKLKERVSTPLAVVGGIRSGEDIRRIFDSGVEYVSMCRPFVCEPDFIRRLQQNPNAQSACTSCNECAIACDSGEPTRCRKKGGHHATI